MYYHILPLQKFSSKKKSEIQILESTNVTTRSYQDFERLWGILVHPKESWITDFGINRITKRFNEDFYCGPYLVMPLGPFGITRCSGTLKHSEH